MQKVKRTIWLLAFASSLYAATPNCFEFLGAVSDGDASSAIVSTYVQLLDSLGSRLAPATLKRMAEAKDPFTVPEQTGADFFSLESKLKEFERMIERRGWRTPENTTALLTALDQRSQQTAEQVPHREQKIQATAKLVFEGNARRPATAISPDGRYLVMLPDLGEGARTSGKMKLRLNVIDLQTGAVSQVRSPYPLKHEGRLSFTPEGKSLLLFNDKHEAIDVPFAEGKIAWPARTSFTFPPPRDGLTLPRPGENPRYAFHDGPGPIQRLDLVTKQTTTVELAANEEGVRFPSVRRIGSVGSSSDIYVVQETQRNRGRVLVIEMGPEGKPKGERVAAQWDHRKPFAALAWTAAGSPLTLNQDTFYEWKSPTERTEIMKISGRRPWDLRNPDFQVWDVKTHATGAVALFSDGHRGRWIEVFDFGAKKITATLPLPEETEVISLSPDGQLLIAKVGTAVHIVNLRERTE